MAKQKQKTQVINNCSTKVRDRDKLTDSAKVGTATDCAYFRDKNKMRVWK